jgi:hypothetical protein
MVSPELISLLGQTFDVGEVSLGKKDP